MTRTRWLDAAAMAVSVAVLAGVTYVSLPRTAPRDAAPLSTATADRPATPDSDRQSMLFVSDSYTAGTGLTEMFYGCLAAKRLGWLCNLGAEAGTGYISGGPANRFLTDYSAVPSTSFAERLPRLAATYVPAVVVLDGGRNDLFAPKDAVFEVMSSTIADVHRTWPTARIVFIRPRSLAHPSDDLGFDDDFIDRLRAETEPTAMVVIDPIGRLSAMDTTSMMSPDERQPDIEGVYAMSSALVDSLVDDGFTMPAP